jgi:drug/metabolite transporter (DMT)-like permease
MRLRWDDVGVPHHLTDDQAYTLVAFTAVDDRRPPLVAYAALLGTTMAFGFSFVATKFALRGFQPLSVALLRFSLAGALLYVIWRLRGGRERLTRRELARLAALGFVSLTVYFTFENLGIARTSASDAAILIGAIPIFVNVINVFTLHEHNSGAQWMGILLSFVGVVALVELGTAGAGGSTLLGNLLVLGASLAAAVYNVAARRLLVTRSALFVTTFQNLFGALFMLPLAAGEALLVGVRSPTAQAVGAVAYLALACSVCGYLLLNYGLRFIEASKASVFINLTPVVAVAAAYVLLGERFTSGQFVAAAVVVVGVWLTNRGGRVRPTAEAALQG